MRLAGRDAHTSWWRFSSASVGRGWGGHEAAVAVARHAAGTLSGALLTTPPGMARERSRKRSVVDETWPQPSACYMHMHNMLFMMSTYHTPREMLASPTPMHTLYMCMCALRQATLEQISPPKVSSMSVAASSTR